MRIYFDTGLGISAQDLPSPLDGIVNTDAVRLSLEPKFQICGSIVELVSVEVMDVFAREKPAPKHALHHDPMLVSPSPVLASNAAIAVGRDVRALQVSDTAPLAGRAAAWGIERFPVVPECPSVMDAAISFADSRFFTIINQATRAIGITVPP